MTTRKRISSKNPTGGGGAGSVAPTVGVGPTYGPGNPNNNGVSVMEQTALTLPAVGLGVPFNERLALAFALAAANDVPLVEQMQLTAALVATEQTLAEQLALTMPLLAVVEPVQQEQEKLSLATVAPSYSLTERTKLTGTALGAPFWQSVGLAANSASSNNIVVNKPSGVQVGDLLLAFLAASVLLASSGPHIDVPAGWTAASGDSVVGDPGSTTRIYLRALWRIADGTEGSTFTFTCQNGANQFLGQVHRINGTHPTTPINATSITGLVATSLVTNPVSPSVTTTAANCLVFRSLAHYHGTLSNTHTAPASHVERTDAESTVSSAILSLTTDERVYAAAAATGTATHTCTETAATDAVMLAVAIAPGPVTLL